MADSEVALFVSKSNDLYFGRLNRIATQTKINATRRPLHSTRLITNRSVDEIFVIRASAIEHAIKGKIYLLICRGLKDGFVSFGEMRPSDFFISNGLHMVLTRHSARSL